MNKTDPIKDPSVMDKDPSVMDKNLSVMSETPTVMGEETTSMLQKITRTLLSAILHPKETCKNYIKNKELKRKEKGIKKIMEIIRMPEDNYFGYSKNSIYRNELEKFHDYFRINYCREYLKTHYDKKIEKEEEKKVIKFFQNGISKIRDKIFQNPQIYLWPDSYHFYLIGKGGHFEKLIKEAFDDYLIELNAKGKEKDNLLSDISWGLRTGFNAVLKEYYKPGTTAYYILNRAIKSKEN